ncbi:MAG: hypothetical protein LBK07_01990, partial [Tannerella sp.]|nr:hypothetical protein [Tannerella sp.]
MKARRYKHTVNGGCMKAVLFFCAVLFAHGARAQIELKSGLIVSGGESMYYDVIPRVSPEGDVPVLYGDRKFDVAAGYKFRLQPAGKRFFADLDIQAGYGQVRYENHYTSFEDMNPLLDRGKDNYLRLSLNPTFNCKVYDGWYAGLGVEPT